MKAMAIFIGSVYDDLQGLVHELINTGFCVEEASPDFVIVTTQNGASYMLVLNGERHSIGIESIEEYSDDE